MCFGGFHLVSARIDVESTQIREWKKKKKSGESACWFESSAGAMALEPHPLFPDYFQVDWKMKKEEKWRMFGKCKETTTLIGC